MSDLLKYINIHTHNDISDQDKISVINIFPDKCSQINDNSLQYYSIGIHPKYIDEQTYIFELQIIEKMSSCKSVIAIGETGIDRLGLISTDLQIDIFKKHISIANKFKKPLIIHCVKAHNEIMSILKKTKNCVPVIFHGFNQKAEIASEILKQGYYISIGHSVFNSNSNAFILIRNIDLSKIFFENDDKDFSIEEIYKYVSEIKNISIENIKESIFQNFCKVFKNE
jgi:TatD DNase family protein